MAFYEVRITNVLESDKRVGWHFDLETPVSLTGTELQDVVDTAFTEWKTHADKFAADQSLNGASIQGMERLDNCPLEPAGVFVCPPNNKVRFVRKPTTPEINTTVAGTAGTAIGDSLPPNVSVLVRFRTASVGRRFQGRVYLPPPPELVVGGDGVITVPNDYRDAVQETIEAAEGAIAPVDVDHVVWSIRYDEQAEVTSYAARSRVVTQRPRND